MKATLKFPVLGYVEIRLMEKHGVKWLVELIEAGMHIEVFEDEFLIEKQNNDGLAISFEGATKNN